MKKCTICEKMVEDGAEKCPNCGHDFNFVYKKDEDALKKRFEAPDNPRESLGKSLVSFVQEYVDVRDIEAGLDEKNKQTQGNMLSFVRVLRFDRIINCTKNEEDKINALELRNRNYFMMFLSIIIIIISEIVLYENDKSGILWNLNVELRIMKIGIYACAFITVVSAILYYFKKNKILQDLALCIIFLQYSNAIYMGVASNTNVVLVWLHFIYLLMGIGCAFTYCRVVGKSYPLCFLGFVLGAVEMFFGYFIMDILKFTGNDVIRFGYVTSIDCIFSMLSTGFGIVFLYDFIKVLKRKN